MLLMGMLKMLKTIPLVDRRISFLLWLNQSVMRLSQTLLLADNAIESTSFFTTMGIVFNNLSTGMLKTLLKTGEFSTKFR